MTGVSDIDFDAFRAHLIGQHNIGPWLLAAKLVYVSGDEADADLNTRGIGNRSDVNGFRYLGVDSSHFYGSWFELLGKSDVDTTGDRTFRRMGETAHLERFGWVIIGGKVEYKYTNELVLTGAAGGFWTAEKTGRPAVFRLGSPPVPAQELARRKIVRGSRPSISPATAASSVGRSM